MIFVADGQNPCALVVMGVSGSGKSTIADRLAVRIGWRFEDGDSFHPPSNVAKMHSGQPLTDEDRWPWLRAIAAEIDRSCGVRERAVIACSALKRVYRDILVHVAVDALERPVVLTLEHHHQIRPDAPIGDLFTKTFRYGAEIFADHDASMRNAFLGDDGEQRIERHPCRIRSISPPRTSSG